MSRVQFDPRVPGRAYAHVADDFYLSEDHGDHWELRAKAPQVLTQLSFPADSTALLAGSRSGVLRSEDAGASWTALSLGGLRVSSLVSSPAVPLRVYATIDRLGLVRSEDGGLTWEGADQGAPYAVFTGLTALPAEPSTALASFGGLNTLGGFDGTGGVVRTDDGGGQWRSSLDGLRVQTLAQCANDPGILWASQNRDGLARSEDGGRSWASVGVEGRVTAVAAAGDACERVYALVYEVGLFRSHDAGASWEGPFSDGVLLHRLRLEGLAVDPQDPDRVLIATHGGGFGSRDGGLSWERLDGLGRVSVRRIAVSPAAPEVAWLTSWGSGVWSRQGSEASWQWSPEFHDDFGYDVEPLPDDRATVLVGGWPYVERSTDEGASFDFVGVKHSAMDIASHPEDPQRILMATQTGGVWRSYDGGASWEEANGTLQPWATAEGTFIDTRKILHLGSRSYLGTNGRGLYASDDFGDRWDPVAPSLAQQSITCLAHDGDAVLACVKDSGVFRSTDGVTFVEDNAGLVSLDVRDLLFDAIGGVAYASTSGGVFQRSHGGGWQPLESECLPEAGSLTIVQGTGERLLLAAGGAGISAYPLP